MFNTGKIVTATAILLTSWSSSAGDLSLHSLFTDNMVLQRRTPVAVYGKAEAGTDIRVIFAGQNVETRTGTDGQWIACLTPMEASTNGASLAVQSGTGNSQLQCSITNVLIGDVWFCSGQSNMDNPFRTYSLLKKKTSDLYDPMIRLYMSAHQVKAGLQEEPVPDPVLQGSWQECSGQYLNHFSVTAYYFGARLRKELNIPIGLIESAWGGTRIESWMPEKLLREPGEPVRSVSAGTALHQNTPSALYDTMVHPFRNFVISGIIWYQGESNGERPVEYAKLFPAMIESWRGAWGRDDLPFYFVQVAPFKTLPWDVTGEAWAWLREAQTAALKLPRTGMVVTTDIGEYEDVHPQTKRPVGERLAAWALRNELCDVPLSGPVFKQMKINDDICMLWFEYAVSGLETRRVVMNKNRDLPVGADTDAFRLDADKLYGFTICGEDRRFVEADARIAGSQVVVWNRDIKNPVAVRYGWANFPLCNLFNKNGLPAFPFRTDDFPPPAFHGESTGRP